MTTEYDLDALFFDFDSDLSSLSSDEEDELEPEEDPTPPPPTASSSKTPAKKVAPAKKAPAKAKQKAAKATYVVQECLRPPRTTQLSVRSLHEQITNGTVDLDPDYQRDVVWSEAKQVGVIDSIFRNFYVPPVIFAVTFADDGTENKTCIDGKQRLTSIRKFVDGLIPHRDSITGKKYWYRKTSNSTGVQLPKNMQQLFDNKQITCMEYGDLTGDQEREIFQRVQLGVALTPAERMQAITGPRASFVRKMMDDVLGADGFGEALEWGRARGRDFQGLASIVYLIDHLPAYKTPASGTMETWLNKQDAISEKAQDDIESTLKIFRALTTDPKLNKVFHKPVRVSPVEFVFIGIMVQKHKNTLSLTQLSNAIEAMRADVRKAFGDIRMNGKVSKRLFTFIENRVPQTQYKGDGKGDQPAAKAVPLVKTLPKKRKRTVETSSESEEESSEEEILSKSRTNGKAKASTSKANGTSRSSAAKPSVASTSKAVANVKKESPAPSTKSAKKPKVDPSPSSKPPRIHTSASADRLNGLSFKKTSSSVKNEPESPLVTSGSFTKPGPASSKRAAAAKAERARANEAMKQSDSPSSSVPGTPVVQQPAMASQIPGVADHMAMMNFLVASGFINPNAMANGMPVMNTQPNLTNGAPLSQGNVRPAMFNGAMPMPGTQFPHQGMPPFAPNASQQQPDAPPSAPSASQPLRSRNAPSSAATAHPPSSSAPPLGPSASAPSVMHARGRPASPPRMPASMKFARKPSMPSGLPPKPQPAPQLPPDDVLSGSPEISRRPSSASSASYPQPSYPVSASPTNSAFNGRSGYDRGGWDRTHDRDRGYHQGGGGGGYGSRPNSYCDERRGSGQYGYRSDYGRDSGWR